MVEEKKILRQEVRSRLAVLSHEEIEERSRIIAEAVMGHIAVSGAKVVALFSPLPGEPVLWPLVERLSRMMLVVLPRVCGDEMDFYCYDRNCMAQGSFGIMEPQCGEPVAPGEIGVVIVPGVAFTEGGCRMGRGKGFYDRYLSHDDFCGLKIGVCFREQIFDELPVEPHDVRMDVVIKA